ncbi:SRPBCC family protein [Virgibacillus kekensis]|uniref:SRPBCC family protein n=1 Tax=Virgibacillus kekensis TaxID=202261 RepID=A0ABV9DQU0_9BACI
MDNKITSKMKINKPAGEVFEAFVDPDKIGNFWFSSSSERWHQGSTVTLRYDEYDAEGAIDILVIQQNEKIVYVWGPEKGEKTTVTIELNSQPDKSTIVEVTESDFNEDDPNIVAIMLGQKEGWVYMLTCLKGYLEHGVSDLRGSLVH